MRGHQERRFAGSFVLPAAPGRIRRTDAERARAPTRANTGEPPGVEKSPQEQRPRTARACAAARRTRSGGGLRAGFTGGARTRRAEKMGRRERLIVFRARKLSPVKSANWKGEGVEGTGLYDGWLRQQPVLPSLAAAALSAGSRRRQSTHYVCMCACVRGQCSEAAAGKGEIGEGERAARFLAAAAGECVGLHFRTRCRRCVAAASRTRALGLRGVERRGRFGVPQPTPRSNGSWAGAIAPPTLASMQSALISRRRPVLSLSARGAGERASEPFLRRAGGAIRDGWLPSIAPTAAADGLLLLVARSGARWPRARIGPSAAEAVSCARRTFVRVSKDSCL